MSLLRRRLVAGAVLAVVAVVAAVLVLRSSPEPAPRSGIDIGAGRDRARAACAAADDVFRLVEEDGPAPDVMAAAEVARRESARARDLDPLWSTLASGADALREGLRGDDARAAGLGRRVLDVQCAQVRAPAPAPS